MMRAILLAVAIAAGANAVAQAPRTIAYQGYLTTPDGVPVSASQEMTFSLYAQPGGGAPVWSETQTVAVSDGTYRALLGIVTPLPVAFDTAYYLGVTVGTDAEMVPRQALSAAPYALFAESARCNPGDIIGCAGGSGDGNVGACQAGKRVCNEQGTAYGPCEGQQDPSPELCDGIDNDCDGQVDEDFPDKHTSCVVGVGACLRSGVRLCSSDGVSTVCNATPGEPASEACDHIDNDCDGQIDEDFPDKAAICTVGFGACLRGGLKDCSLDGTATTCNAMPGEPTAEVCDYVDNDCDGEIDENYPDKGTLCTVGLGACLRGGVIVCDLDVGNTACSATPGDPVAEVCNAIDDDCDGVVDNGATCSLPNAESTSCLGGGCVVLSCAEGFLNCDGNHANGCETAGLECP